MGFFLNHIDSMDAYIPGESPKGSLPVVKLNQNENPYPPSPKVAEVLKNFDPAGLKLYPAPMADEFRKAAADFLSVKAENICIGDGSDDLIIMIARAASGPGKAIAFSEPNFPYYYTQAAVQDAPVIAVPADTETFFHPIEALADTGAAVTFVANPNSPTGAVTDLDQLRWLAGKLSGILVIDEAYADFAGFTAAQLAYEFDNVIVIRTLSKSHSLAGLRLGYAVAGDKMLTGLLKTRAIYNVGALPAAIGAAAISDRKYLDRCVKLIIDQRTRLENELKANSWRVWPSGGNFIMASPPDGNAEGIFNKLKARNILIRYFKKPPMADKLRISIGTAADIDALLAAL